MILINGCMVLFGGATEGDGGKSSRSSTSTKQQAQCQVRFDVGRTFVCAGMDA
jgi:hypothetical protein